MIGSSGRGVNMHEVVFDTAKKLPVWARSFGIADDGTIYAPAAIGGNEDKVVLMALMDGQDFVRNRDHAYVPCDWLEREFPEFKGAIGGVLVAAKRAVDKAKEDT